MLTYIGAIFLAGIHLAAPYPSRSTIRGSVALRTSRDEAAGHLFGSQFEGEIPLQHLGRSLVADDCVKLLSR